MVEEYSGDGRLVTSQQTFAEAVENSVQLANSFIQIKSLKKIENNSDNLEVKDFIPEGQDLVLSNLSNETDYQIYYRSTSLLSVLILMQNTHKASGKFVGGGVLPCISQYGQRIQWHTIGTRTKGTDRERKLHGQRPKEEMDRRGFGEMLFGPVNKK